MTRVTYHFDIQTMGSSSSTERKPTGLKGLSLDELREKLRFYENCLAQYEIRIQAVENEILNLKSFYMSKQPLNAAKQNEYKNKLLLSLKKKKVLLNDNEAMQVRKQIVLEYIAVVFPEKRA